MELWNLGLGPSAGTNLVIQRHNEHEHEIEENVNGL